MKKPWHLKKNICVIYSPRTVTVEPATCSKIDTEIVLILQRNAKPFRRNQIFEINGETQRLWIKILNKSYNEPIKISKNTVLGFIVIEPEFLSYKHETANAKTKKKEKILPKTWSFWTKKKRQWGDGLIDMILRTLEGTYLIRQQK